MMRMSNTTSARTSKMWMNPPSVYELTTPSSHSTSRITNIVQSIESLLVATEIHIGSLLVLRFAVGLCSLRLGGEPPRRRQERLRTAGRGDLTIQDRAKGSILTEKARVASLSCSITAPFNVRPAKM